MWEVVGFFFVRMGWGGEGVGWGRGGGENDRYPIRDKLQTDSRLVD